MKLNITQDQLQQTIKDRGQALLNGRQLLDRLKKLMPYRLKEIQDSIDPTTANKRYRTLQQALTSTQYLSVINEYLHISQNTLQSKIEYETNLMLLNARKTIASLPPPTHSKRR